MVGGGGSPDLPMGMTPGSYFYIFMPGTFFRYDMRRSLLAVAAQKLNNVRLREGPTQLLLFTAQDGRPGLSPKRGGRVLLHGP
jgi:hypothetical protein